MSKVQSMAVIGDVALNWRIETQAAQVAITRQLGGAWSLAQVLEQALKGIAVYHVPFPSDDVTPGTCQYRHHFTLARKTAPEQSLGYMVDRCDPQTLFEVTPADGVIIWDQGLDIRHQALPSAFIDQCRHLIFHSSAPVFQGHLWRSIYDRAMDKLILCVDVESLRAANVSISKGLSWEHTTQTLLSEIYERHNPLLFPLRRVPYAVVMLGTTGALLLDNTTRCVSLLYCPQKSEEAQPNQARQTMSLLAALAHALTAGLTPENLQRAIQIALQVSPEANTAHLVDLITAREITPSLDGYISVITQPLAQMLDSHWSILSTRCNNDIYELARRIVLGGPQAALLDVPVVSFGKLQVVDRYEIEAYRNLEILIREYLEQTRIQRALSIAIFGQPGSGKSFGVTEVARSLTRSDKDIAIKKLVFNLSEFESPRELIAAFHMIRDVGLYGGVPLVFWDEFDSNKLAWLTYFLAPMQDGVFREGEILHPIGKAIFVFAGGTCRTVQEFIEKNQGKYLEKVPDFLSRLKGFIDIKGPNPVGDDTFYMIRRALLLHSILLSTAGEDITIDEGLVNAFLNIDQFHHGVRSMEAVVATSRLRGKSRFDRSVLPPVDQLALHVDGPAFLDLANQVTLPEEAIEQIAYGIHAVWRNLTNEGSPIPARGFDTYKQEYQQLPIDEKLQNRSSARSIVYKLHQIGYAVAPKMESAASVELSKVELDQLAQLEHQRWVRQHLSRGWRHAEMTDKLHKCHAGLTVWDEDEIEKLDEIYGQGMSERIGRIPLSKIEKDKDYAISSAIPYILASVGYMIVAANDTSQGEAGK